MTVFTSVAQFLGQHRDLLTVAALALAALVLLLVVRRAVKGGRPDRWVDAVAFIVALAFSAEGMWEIATQELSLPRKFAWLVFFLFEAWLVSAMLRANRHQRLYGNPGRAGRAVWLIASVMGLIVAFSADSFIEAPLRLAIPLLAAYQWWLGLTADGVTEYHGAVSWRWTPRRLLLWLGAIEPGERDVVTVDRERRVAQMTALEYRRRYGWAWLQGRRSTRLARLSLSADDQMIAQVQQRVDRASWFMWSDTPVDIQAVDDETPALPDVDDEGPDMPGDFPGGVGSGVQYTAEQAAMVARALTAASPDMDPATIAGLVGRSERQVKRYLTSTATPRVNGAAVAHLVKSEP